MPQLGNQVEASAALAPLREPTLQLRTDFEQYKEVPGRILLVVEKHENTQPEFKDLIAEGSAARGKVVKDAATLQKLCSDSGRFSARGVHYSTIACKLDRGQLRPDAGAGRADRLGTKPYRRPDVGRCGPETERGCSTNQQRFQPRGHVESSPRQRRYRAGGLS